MTNGSVVSWGFYSKTPFVLFVVRWGFNSATPLERVDVDSGSLKIFETRT